MDRNKDGVAGGALFTRRSLVLGTGVAAMMAGGLPYTAGILPVTAGANPEETLKMILRRDRPLNLETPRQALASWLTPTRLFYVRNHYDNPDVVPATWRISIGGEVEHAIDIGLEALHRLPKRTILCPLECTGNGRAYFDPKTRGNQWEVGAVGHAVWSGARLSDVLAGIGIRASGKFATFVGGEKLPAEKAPRFIRSVPIDTSMRDVLLAYEMNGEPLTPDHGYPVRAIVPGWYGASAVKWLKEIRITREPDPGRYMQRSYRIALEGQKVEDAKYTNVMKVKSIIALPLPGRLLAGPIAVQGAAWTGQGAIARVEFSADAGTTWRDAELTGLESSRFWQTWFYLWEARSGSHRLMSRATDSAGRTQPLQIAWNQKGYANNAALDHAVDVTVA